MTKPSSPSLPRHSRGGHRLGLALCFLSIAALIVAPSFRSIMHESDQAALLRGAWTLAQAQLPVIHADAYNYNRLFFTYWMLAALFRFVRLIAERPDIVLLGNVFSASLFSLALGHLLWRRARHLHAGLVLATVLAPAILIHAPYLAAAFTSGAFLLWLFIDFSAPRITRPRRRLAWAGFLAFAAVGCREDAVLVLPFLCWLTIWPLRAPWRLFANPRFWAAVLGAVAALAVGRAIGSPDVPMFNIVFVVPKVLLAFAVFGLGAVAVLLPLLSGWLARLAVMVRGARRWSYLTGLGLLWLPFVYYCLQLFSPRYWIVGILSVLMALCSRRWEAFWRIWCREPSRWREILVAGSVFVAVAPLAIGLTLPTVSHPRLCFSNATIFPSSDGMIPMGAYVEYVHGSRRTIPDHNQAIWLAALQSKLDPAPDGTVPVLKTTVFEITQLACLVRGLTPQITAETGYTDVRALIKPWVNVRQLSSPPELPEPLSTCSITEVSPRVDGLSLVYVNCHAPPSSANAIWRAGLEVFRGSDFRLFPLSARMDREGRLRLPLQDGRGIAVFARQPFALVGVERRGTRRRWASEAGPSFGYFRIFLPGAETLQFSEIFLEGGAGLPSEDAAVAQSVLPDYMNLRAMSEQ